MTFVKRSLDGGMTFGASIELGVVDTPGFDVGRFGLATLGGASETVMINHDDGEYEPETRGGEDLTDSYPIAICIPDLRNGNSSLQNTSDEPSYIFATASLVEDEAFFKVINSRTAMTPSVGGNKAVGAGTWGIAAWRGKRFMIVGEVTDEEDVTTRFLFRTKTTGQTWLNDEFPTIVSVRAQQFSTTGNEWIIALGDEGVQYTNDAGTNWDEKSDEPTDYAEIFG